MSSISPSIGVNKHSYLEADGNEAVAASTLEGLEMTSQL